MLSLEEQASFGFGLSAEEGPKLGEGWANPEEGFQWSVGDRSRLSIPAPSTPGNYTLLLTFSPFIHPGGPRSQRLSVLVNGRRVREGRFQTDTVMACRFEWDPRLGGKVLDIVLEHPDAARPSECFASPDTRRLAFSVSDLKLFRVLEAAEAATDPGRNGQDRGASAGEGTPEADKLLLRFASLGDNCEFGMVQRHLRAEAMDLFRFSAVPLRSVVNALRDGLRGIDAPERIEIQLRGPEPGRREFIFCHTLYQGLEAHTQVFEGQQPGHRVFVREQRRVSFLMRMMLNDLKLGRRIMVIKRNDPIALAEVMPLFHALRQHGPNALLWVEQARDGNAPGTVEVLREGLMKGYVARLAPYDKADTCDAGAWLPVCRRAYALWREMQAAASPPVAQAEGIGV
jgi:hypothetical protein